MRRCLVWLISPKKIREAIAEHGEWEASLVSWRKIAKKADWRHFPDVKRSWQNSDKIGTCVVFDIDNNRCRLISRIFYEAHRVYILHVISHAKYDKGGWKSDCDCT
jgi:mRNA interferase HigB